MSINEGDALSRLTISILLFAPILLAQTPKDPILEGLASSDVAVVVKTLELVRSTRDIRPVLVPALLPLIRSRAPRVRPLAIETLDRIGPAGLDQLLRAAESGEESTAVSALRQIAKVGDLAAREKLYELLGHKLGRVESEACRAIFFLADTDSDARMRQRYDELAKATAELDPARDGDDARRACKRFDDTLYYLAMRKLPGTFELLVQALERPSFRSNTTAIRLLSQLHAKAFHPVARKLIRRVAPPVQELLHELILSLAQPEDRKLGLTLLRSTLPDGDPKAERIETLLDATSQWLGIVVPDDAIESVRFKLELENAVSKQKRVLQHSTSKTAHQNTAYAGITLDFPLADLLHRPLRYERETENTPKGLKVRYRVKGDRTASFSFGLGTRRAKIWYGREVVQARTIETLFDQRDRPRRTTLFGEDGGVSAQIAYREWIETPGGKSVPGLIEVESARATLTARYAWPKPGLWHLQHAIFSTRQVETDGTRTTQKLAEARTKGLEVATKP